MADEDKYHEAERQLALNRAAPKMLGALRSLRLELLEMPYIPFVEARQKLRILLSWVDRGLEGTEDL